jgi:hypothetical protein
MFYTGVGSRNTPTYILWVMEQIAIKMAHLGYTLRSGGANGPDSIFERGAGASDKDIFYIDHLTTVRNGVGYHRKYDDTVFSKAQLLAGQFHPVWDVLRKDGSPVVSDYAKKLHGRNSFQILGCDLNIPSLYCICWTPDGCYSHASRSVESGGTGTAISIADHYNVPVINLAIDSELINWTKWATGGIK